MEAERKKNILALIPARSGSKSVPHKNIRLINGKPMMAYSIEHARDSKYINRIIVSTDSEKYAEIAKEYGAEVPFLRPAEYAGDDSTDLEVFTHCLKTLRETEGYETDIVVQLRPTYPIRRVSDIDNMIEILLNSADITSVRSIAPAREIPYKMWKMEEDGKIKPLMTEIPECYNMPRQRLPKVYYQNACIDVVRGWVIEKEQSMNGKNIYGYVMEDNFDIDTEDEFRKAQEYLNISGGGKRFVFDIDGVIAKFNKELTYDKSLPEEKMIKAINNLYDKGNEIILHTARGYVTGIDWEDVTKNQLEKWGLKYHELHFGKPNADYYIDDKMIPMEMITELFG